MREGYREVRAVYCGAYWRGVTLCSGVRYDLQDKLPDRVQKLVQANADSQEPLFGRAAVKVQNVVVGSNALSVAAAEVDGAAEAFGAGVSLLFV